MEIRRFDQGDEKILSELIREDLKTVNVDDPKWENDYLYAQYTPEYMVQAAKEGHVYVITDPSRDGFIVGTGMVTKDGDDAEIHGCFIRKEYLRKGLGRLLFDTLEHDEISLAANRLWLTTSVLARPFYEKIGYRYTYGYLGRNADNLVEMEKTMKKKTIGILGGMGPLATADLFKKIILMTEAEKDQDHIRVLIDSNTNIPDRTAAILSGGADPVPELTKSAKILEQAGADLLIMPCNTAHYFYEDVKKAVSIPVLSIIESAADKVLRSGQKKALILATDGTGKAGVYDKVFNRRGIETVYPDAGTQKKVMSIIYEGVKAGAPKEGRMEKLTADINEFIKKIGTVAVLACTELPLAVDLYGLTGDFVDATGSLAEAAILFSGYQVRKDL